MGLRSVITIIRMCMIMNTAFAVIREVCCNDENYGGDQQPCIIMNKKQLNYQKNDAEAEQDKRPFVMMVFPVSVIKGISADTERQKDHKSFESQVMDNIYAKQRKG
jgi:hypothetical protein